MRKKKKKKKIAVLFNLFHIGYVRACVCVFVCVVYVAVNL